MSNRSLFTHLLLTLCVTSIGFADTSYTGIVTAEGSELRAGAGRTFYVVGLVKKGDLVKVDEVIYGWFKVSPPDGTYSYIRKANVDAKGDGSVGLVNTSGTRVIAGAVDGPGASYRRQLDLNKDDRVKIVGDDGDFYRIEPPAKAFVYLPPGSLRRATPDELKKTPEPKVETANVDATPKVDTTSALDKAIEKAAEPPSTGISGAKGEPDTKVEPVAAVTVEPKVVTPEPKVVEPLKPEPAADTAKADEPQIVLVSSSAVVQKIEKQFRSEMTKPLEDQALVELETQFKTLLQDESLSSFDKRFAGICLARVKRNATLVDALGALSMAKTEGGVTLADITPKVPAGAPKFDMVGKLTASAIYDGGELPRLYRLVDPTTKQTIGYVRPGEAVSATESLGKLVGIKGESRYDPAMNLKVVDVVKLTLLSATGEPVATEEVAVPEPVVFEPVESVEDEPVATPEKAAPEVAEEPAEDEPTK